MADATDDDGGDALDELRVQDDILARLFDSWNRHTKELEGGDDVDVRWRRGSETKLMLDHLAVRESAKQALSARLREVGANELADRFEGDGRRRRELIDRFEDLIKGQQPIMANTPDHDELVIALQALFHEEAGPELEQWLPEARKVLGETGERGLPAGRRVRMLADTHPSPEPGFVDKVGPLRAVRALYDHLRGLPGGGTNSAVDIGESHRPGPR
jgi:hypothetical protein